MNARAELPEIFKAALAAVEPSQAVQRFLRRAGNTLILETGKSVTYDLTRFERILVIGAGKATAPMAQAVEEVLGDLLTGGLIVVKYGHELPLRRVVCREAAHPVPDANGLKAGGDLLAFAESATSRDLMICLLSGGGSALLESLPPPLTLADLQATNELLLGSGATIVEVNSVRKHLSRLKGGRLAEAIDPATIVTLLLSDVVGSPLSAIASGPTVADDTTWGTVQMILDRYDLAPRLPHGVLTYLRAGIAGRVPETPKRLPRAPVVVVGDNARAARAARDHAEASGFRTQHMESALEGEAAGAGQAIARQALHVQASHPTAPVCLVYGGETTVTLGDEYGTGGRNQELALAAAVALEGTDGITVGAFATDGTDGPTDSAGAIVDGGTVARGGGISRAQQHLDAHNSYPFLLMSGDLLRTGPTYTNVNDLVVVLIKSDA